jgi:hypothetical protein
MSELFRLRKSEGYEARDDDIHKFSKIPPQSSKRYLFFFMLFSYFGGMIATVQGNA